MKNRWIILIYIVALLFVTTLPVSAAEIEGSGASQPWKFEYVDWYEGSNVGTHVSIARHPLSGKLYISYYDSVNTALKMAHEVSLGTGNCGKNNSWMCETVDKDYDVGKYSSIDVVYIYTSNPILNHTKIGISFYDETKQRLRYATCNSGGLYTCKWQVYNVDDSSNEMVSIGQYSSLKFDSGNVPHIAYYSQGPLFVSAVKYATYTGEGTGNCIEGGSWDCETIDSSAIAPDHGSHPSLDFPSGIKPSIAFYNAELGALELAIPGTVNACSNPNWMCTTIDDNGDVGQYASLVYGHDPRMFAYYDATHLTVKYAEYVGSGGNCTHSAYNCYAVDTVGAYSGTMDPIFIDKDTEGKPIIAYMQSEEQGPTNLKIARPASSYGLLIGNCGDVPPGYLLLYWQCTNLDNGNSYADEAAFVAVSVSPSGLTDIAYSEYNNRDNEYYLKVARQQFGVYLPFIQH